jgi:predicted metal-dependent peptidase
MTRAQQAEAERRLAAARTRLIVDKPFIGVLLLHLPLQPAAWCERVATDARRIYYNPAYVQALNARQIQFVLAHEALHCALGHFARRGHRLVERWDAACDLAVNLLLVEEGFEPVPDAAIDARLRGLSAEEIYPLLADAEPRPAFDAHLFGAGASAVTSRPQAGSQPTGAGAPPDADSDPVGAEDALDSDAAPQGRRSRAGQRDPVPAAPLSTDELTQQWQLRFAQAAQQARHAGRLSASWQRLLSAAIEPPLPWRALLARLLASRAQEDYSFQRPPRRDSDFLLPRLRSESIEAHAVLDTSGSVGEPELAAFAAEIDALKGQVRARVTLHACDRALAPESPWVFEPWQPLVLPQRLAGGGGTDFRPVFEWLRDNRLQPDVLIYFTDAEGEFPPQAPPYPVAWLVKGNAPVPWGERIAFN